jgi:hypothetical protein
MADRRRLSYEATKSKCTMATVYNGDLGSQFTRQKCEMSAVIGSEKAQQKSRSEVHGPVPLENPVSASQLVLRKAE